MQHGRNYTITGLIPQSIQLLAQLTKAKPGQMLQIGTVRKYCARRWCVSAVRAMEVAVSVCLRSSCNHVTEVGGP